MEVFRNVFDQKFQVFVWENALRKFIETDGLLDRRGIILGSEEELHAKRSRVLEIVRDILGLRETPGWGHGPPDYATAIMESFYLGSSHRIAWVMVETCREQMSHRHERVQDSLLPGESPVFLRKATMLHATRSHLPLKAGACIPSRNLRFSLPAGRDERSANLAHATVVRKLWTPGGERPSQAIITNWCVANQGQDDADLARGYVPAGLQCRRPDGINAARLIMWYRLNPVMKHGYLESYAVDIDPITGQALSFRYQETDLRTAVKIDPWLNDWLTYGLGHFQRYNPGNG